MRAGTEYRIKVIHAPLTHTHIITANAMLYKNIFHITAHIASFDVIILQIRHCHDYHIRIHLHHQRNQPVFSYIIRLNLCIIFFQFKDRIIRIAGNIMYNNISMQQQILYNSLKVLIKSITFRVKYQMFIYHREKPFVIAPFPSFIVGKHTILLLFPDTLNLVQSFSAFLQLLVINKSSWFNYPVQNVQLYHRHQIAANPIKRCTNRNIPAQIQRQTNRKYHSTIFIVLRLF